MCCDPPTVINEAPAPPDMTGIIESNEKLAEAQLHLAEGQIGLGYAQLAQASKQWDQQKAILDKVVNVQLDIMKEQHKWASEDRARYQDVFQPLEDELVAEAKDYATEERKELEAGRAAADVTTAFAAQRQNAQRQLESYGVDPSQTRHAALGNTMRAQEAAAQAGAMNTSRLRTEQIGRALRSEALNIGKNYPGQINQTYSGAVNAGSSAIGNYNSAIQANAAAVNASQGFFSNAGSAYAGAGASYGRTADMINSGYANQLSAWDKTAGYAMQAQQNNMELWGTAIGAAGTAIAGFNEGGAVVAPGHQGDSVPAKVQDGEYVVPADVVKRKGTEFFDKLAMTTRKNAGLPERSPPTNVVAPDGTQRKIQPPAALPAPGGR